MFSAGETGEKDKSLYQLYWSAGCGSFAPHAALNEVGASYDLVEIDLERGEHHDPKFLAINPRGQVPALVLPDSTVMTESVAMMMHIADCHPASKLMPPSGESQRGVAYRWLVFCAVNLYEAGCRVSHPSYYTTDAEGHDGIREKSFEDLNAYWEMISDAIDEGPFFFGSTYSVIDICLLMIAQWHPDTRQLLKWFPKLSVLCNSVRVRPAIDEVWRLNFFDD